MTAKNINTGPDSEPDVTISDEGIIDYPNLNPRLLGVFDNPAQVAENLTDWFFRYEAIKIAKSKKASGSFVRFMVWGWE